MAMINSQRVVGDRQTVTNNMKWLKIKDLGNIPPGTERVCCVTWPMWFDDLPNLFEWCNFPWFFVEYGSNLGLKNGSLILK